jgi:hypothetical protein
MLRVNLLVPMLALFAVPACAKSDPVDDNAIAPSGELAGDASATGLATPANAATAEAVEHAALPAAPGGLSWTYRGPDRLAEFGPASSPAFSIQCQVEKEGAKQLNFIRYIPPVAGGQGTLSFTGNGQVASVPIAAVASANGLSGHWRAVVAPNDIARDVAEAFAGPGTVNISISGYPPLVVPSTAEPRRVLAECLNG